MLLALMAAAALAGAEPAPAATGQSEVSPVTVPAPKAAEEPKAKPKQICFTERPTGSRRIQRVCYDRDVYDETRERLSRMHVRESPSLPGGRMGGGPR